jgi:hypothetical protein
MSARLVCVLSDPELYIGYPIPLNRSNVPIAKGTPVARNPFRKSVLKQPSPELHL